MTRPEARPHHAQFSIQSLGQNWLVFEGHRQIALFKPTDLDIWCWSPFEPDIKHNLLPPDQVVDMHTVHNTCINFGMSGWPARWLTSGSLNEMVKWSWLKSAGSELLARIDVAGPEGETGVWLIRIFYDSAWGQYRFQFEIDVRKLDPDPFEGFNLMAAGALEDRPGRRRWSHTVWENPDEKLRRIVLSNALFMCTDYSDARNSHGPWRWRDLPYRNAWFGYATHDTFNPFVLIHRTNAPLRLGTCSQLFDEHLVWNTAGQDNIDDDGFFHTTMSVELVNLQSTIAKELLESAADPVHPRSWRYRDIALAFHLHRINQFAQEVDPWQPEDCSILKVSSDESSAVYWDRVIGHKQPGSIRLGLPTATAPTQLYPIGAVCKVEPNRHYKLSGWIRTQGVKQAAFLELFGYRYTYDNISTPVARSQSVQGDKDWTFVSAELDSGREAYIMPRMVVDGPGLAWFDDLLLDVV